MTVIDMQTMRYLNVLDKITKVKTQRCFFYNNILFFAVPKKEVSKAIGPKAININKMQKNLDAKIKIITLPKDVTEAKEFIESIIDPIKIKSVEVENNFLIINAGNLQTKAKLFGRNKIRFLELKKIIQDQFNYDLKIV